MTRRLTSTLVLTVLTLVGIAQTPFRVQAPASVEAGRPFQVSFVLENANGKNLKLPSFDEVQVLSGPNVSTSMRIVNFEMSQTKTWTVICLAQDSGEVSIGPARIDVQKKTIETDPVTIRVVGGSGAANGSSPQQSDPQRNEPQTTDETARIAENLFVRLLVDKREAYVGEQVTAVLKLYTRIRHETNFVDLPQFSGFWNTSFDVDDEEYRTETVDGRQYKTLVIGRYALFPQRTGEVTISPIKLRSRVQIETRRQNAWNWDPWSDPFANPFYDVKTVEYNYQSKAATIRVRPLPDEGRPESFDGAVGQFDLETSLDPQAIETDEAATYRIAISGTGNLMMLAPPAIDLGPDVEIYDPQTEEDIGGRTVGGSLTHDILLVPQAPGPVVVPPYEFAYFDPDAETYRVLRGSSDTLDVTGEPTAEATADEPGRSVEVLDRDIRHIHTGSLRPARSGPWSSPGFYVALGAPVALLGILLLVRRRAADDEGRRTRRLKRAGREALRRLKAARPAMNAGDDRAFYQSLTEVLRTYTEDRLDLNRSDHSRASVRAALVARDVPMELADDLLQLLDHAEAAIYTPTSTAGDLRGDHDRAARLITELERHLRS